jgi:hypothetical protein
MRRVVPLRLPSGPRPRRSTVLHRGKTTRGPGGAILLLGLLPFLFTGCSTPPKILKGDETGWYMRMQLSKF